MKLLLPDRSCNMLQSDTKVPLYLRLPTDEIIRFNLAEDQTIRPIYDMMTSQGLSLLDHKLLLQNPYCELEISRSTANMTLYELNIRPNEMIFVIPC
ncbi:unnamed protein product [Bursaphelenchus xylophilus]|uniref:(pine wood nematode) hypothetical protein n=1 Tax=Bursaphelenchus xylophilus TaxID=6326 RepID=A0A1I7STL6_BURXY|nr:unnamed protein product [Bursaphelenchus xylophilus]CAG9108252.1 unnamed protein product [Bursaphelenchus xylophilus]